MKRYQFKSILLLSLCLAACTKNIQAPQDQTTAPVVADSPYVEGELYVKFTPQFTASIENGGEDNGTKALADIKDVLGVQSMERLFPHAGQYEERTRREGLHQWYVVRYSSAVESTKASLDFNDFEFVEVAEPVRKMAIAEYNDPYYYRQWDLYNDGEGNHKTAGIDMNVERVWDKYSTGDPSVIVSVVDTGVDGSHEDLEFNYVGGYNFVDGTSRVTPGDHGTHVSGTIAATNNNGKGIRGIAGGDYAAGKRGVGILSCQVFTDKGNGGFPNAIKYGADHGAVISQNSWGNDYSDYKNPYQAAKDDHASAALISAIDYFVKYAGCDNNGDQLPDSPMKGGVVIFAAGNDNWDVNCICTDCDVISVAAVSSSGTKASYSNYGPWVDICAPGGEMSWGSSYGIASTVPGGEGYAYMQGTSMACPHVSGEAALIVSYFGGPGFTNEMLKDRLINGANAQKPSQTYAIGPLADVLGSFVYGNTNPPAKVEKLESSEVKSNFATFTFKAVADAEGMSAYAYVLMASKNKSDFDKIDPRKLPSSITKVLVPGAENVGDTIGYTLELNEFDTDYYVAVITTDYSSNYSDLSNIVKITTGSNHAPEVTTDYTGDYRIRVTQALNVDYYITDPDGHSFTTSVSGESSALSFTEIDNGHYQMRIVGKDAEPGKYKAEIVAVDKYNAKTNYVINYEILENQAPEVVNAMPNRAFKIVGQHETLDMSRYIVDPDGDNLSYKVETSSANVIHAFQQGNTLELTTMGYGACEVTVTASDYAGKSCQTSFKVLVQSDPVSVSCDNSVAVVTINEEQATNAKVTIVSQTGKVMYEKVSLMGAFDPLEVPVKTWAPGYYTATLVYGSNSGSVKFLKL